MSKFILKFLVFLGFCFSLQAASLAQFSTHPNKKAVIVYDAQKQVLFQHNANEHRYPASLTKLMTLYILFEELSSGRITLTSKFEISKLASMQAPSKLGLKAGEKISVSDLIRALAIKSANDAAVVVAEGISGSIAKFCSRMNKTASKLGMNQTHFENPSGLPNKKQFSTAHDIAVLGMKLFENFPKYWHFLSEKSFQYKGKKIPTHCKVLCWYRGADGAKTGYIAASGFNLFVTANKSDQTGKSKRIFVVVLGGDSCKLRDLYAAKLMDQYLGNFKFAVSKKQPPQISQKQRNSLMNQVAKSDMNEIIIQEEEEFSINEILQASAVDKVFFDKLYEFEDEAVEAQDELYIAPKAAPKKAQKITKKAALKATSKKKNSK